MATRLYLPSSGAVAVSPAFDATQWAVSASADRIRASAVKSGTAFANKLVAETSAVAASVLVRQFVSDPIQAQTISGTAKGIIRALESVATADMRAQLGLRVVSGDGLIQRGTLLAPSTAALASEFALALTNRKFPLAYAGAGAALTQVAAQAGDRLVVEVGYRAHNTTATSRSATFEFGDLTTVGDLAEDETGTAQLCPWVELSQDIAFVATERLVTWVWPGIEVYARTDTAGRVIGRRVNNPSALRANTVITRPTWPQKTVQVAPGANSTLAIEGDSESGFSIAT